MALYALALAAVLVATPGDDSDPGGWHGLTWGMTVQEVTSALEAHTSLLDLGEMAPGVSSYATRTLPDSIADAEVSALLTFWRGKLCAIALRPADKDLRPSEAWGWAVRVSGLLKEKYGTPLLNRDWTSEGTLGDIMHGRMSPMARWNKGATDIIVTAMGSSDGGIASSLRYADRAAWDEAMVEWARAREAKRKAEASKL